MTNYPNASATADTSPAPLAQLEARRLTVRFGRQTVLRNIELKVPRGQTVCIIGESGCGKTVFLKALIGLVRPSAGQVLLNGRELTKLGERDLTNERKRFGFLFQGAALFDSLTVAQNIAFPLRQHTDLPREKVREIVFARLAEVGLPESIVFKKPAELSGGMRKRVGLARALVLEPEIMLYDEPTTGLDPIMSDVINELILRTRRSHPVTSVVVTHDMHTVRKVADRVVMLYPLSRLDASEPQIVYDGSADKMESCEDSRVRQFVRGEAGERISELAEQFAG